MAKYLDYNGLQTFWAKIKTYISNLSGTVTGTPGASKTITSYTDSGGKTTVTFGDIAIGASQVTSGTLPVDRGGTGSGTASGARSNLSVYSKSEVDSMLTGRISVVSELPATGSPGVIYYVGPSGSGSDQYEEYIWDATHNEFIQVGEKSLDLTEYVNQLTISGSGSVVKSVSKSGQELTATLGDLAIQDLSDWATTTTVTISSVSYKTYWPTAPTASNQVYGISIQGGKLYRIYNNKGTYSATCYDTNTTYTNESLGNGYATDSRSSAGVAVTASCANYALIKNGTVHVKFTYAVSANATLNINSKGAKAIFNKGAAIAAGVINAGDSAAFMYDGTRYQLIAVDRASNSTIVDISRSGTTFTATRIDGSTFTFTQQDSNTTYTNGTGLDLTGTTFSVKYGTTAGTACEGNDSRLSDARTPTSHTHGNIQNGGTLQTTDVTIASGDKIIVTDSSDSNKIARTSISFDGSTTSQFLSKKGTWSDTVDKATKDGSGNTITTTYVKVADFITDQEIEALT